MTIAIPGEAANIYWIKSGAASNWSTNTNWSTAGSGGASCACTPTSAQSVIFDGGGTASVNIDQTVYVTSITVTTGYTGTINTQNKIITVSQNISLSSGTFSAQGSSISVRGSWSKTAAASFSQGTSTVTFAATNAQTITSGGGSFNQIIFNGTGGTWTLGDNLTAVSTITLTAGTLDPSASNFGITVGGNWTNNSGVFTARNSTVTFNGTLAGQKVKSNGKPFANVVFGGNGTSYWTMIDSMTLLSTMTITAGTLDASSSNFGISVAGGWLNSGGTFLANASTVTFNGTTTGLRIQSNGKPFSYLAMTGSGYWTLTDSMTVTSTMTFTSGTLDTSASNFGIAITGSWLQTGGTFTGNASTVTFAGNVTGMKIRTTGRPFPNVSFGGTGYWTLLDSMTVTRNLGLTAGTLDASTSNFPIAVGGGWANTASGATFNARSSTVTFTGASGGGTIQTTGDPFNYAEFNGTNGYWTLVDSVTVVSSMTISAGTLDASTNRLGISVAGGWFQTGGTFNSVGSTVTFTGGAPQNIRTTGRPFGSVSITGAGTWTMIDSMTLTGTLSQSAGTLDTTASNLGVTIGGGLNKTGGTFNVRASTIVFDGSTGGGTLRSGGLTMAYAQFSGPGAYWTLIDSMTVSSTMTITAGTLDTSASNLGIRIGGSWLNTGGNFVGNASTVTFNSSSLQYIDSSGWPFGYVHLIGAGPFTLVDSMTVTNDLTLAVGTFTTTAANLPISVGGEWLNTGGIFSANASSVTFTGTGSANRIIARTSPFYQLFFSGSGSWRTLTNPITVSTVTLNGGSLTVSGGSTMTVRGDLDVGTGSTLTINSDILIQGGSLTNSGTITSLSTPTVTLINAGTLGGSGTSTLPKVTMTGPATTTLGGDVVFLGSMTISNTHTLDVSGGDYQITISSHFVNLGNFLAQAGTVVVNSTAVFTGSTTFNNFQATTAGITLTFPAASTQTINGTLTLTGALNNQIKLRSSSAVQTCFRSLGSASLSYLDVQSNKATGNTLIATQSIHNGTNTNWLFITPRTWVGTTSSWNTAANWNPAGVPSAGDPLVFDGTGNNACTVDVNASAASITIQSGYTQTITANNPVTIYGDLTAANGTYSLGTSSLSVLGSWTNTGMTFNAGSGTVLFNSTTTARTIATDGQPFFNVVFNGSGGYWTLSDSMTVTSSMTLTAGTLDASSGNYDIYIGSSWIKTSGAAASTFVPQMGTVLFGGGPTTAQIRTNGNPFSNVTIGGPGYWTLIDSMTVTSTMTLTSGTLDPAATNFGITVGASWINTNGVFNARSSTVTFNGNSSNLTVQTTGDPFGYVAFTGTNGYWTLADSMTVTSTMTITGGTVDTGSSAGIAVTGSWWQTGGAFVANNSTVTFNGPTTGMKIKTSGRVLSSVSISGAGYWTLLDSMTMTGTFSQSAGTFDTSANNFGMSIGGGYLNTGGVFNSRTSTLTFTGDSGGGFIQQTGDPFAYVVFNGSGDYWTLVDSMTVTSTMTLTAGTLDTSASNLGILVRGSWFNTGGTFLANASTVTFSGTSLQYIDSSGSPFGYVNFTGAGPFNLVDSMTVINDLTISAGTLDTTSSGHAIAVGGEWLNFGGAFNVNASSVSFTGSAAGNRILTRNYRFFQLFFPGPGSWTPMTNSLTVSTLTLNGGDLNIVAPSTVTVLGDLSVGAGSTLSINAALGVGGGTLTNDGTITNTVDMTTVTITGTGTLGGTGSTTLPRVTLSGPGTTTLGGDVVFRGSTTIAANHILDVSGSDYNVTISSDWVNFGTFTPQTGSVVVNSTAVFTGSTTFNNLSVTTAGLTLTFVAGSTQAINGTLTMSGALGNPIRLRSTSTRQACFRSLGSASLQYLDVQDNKATGNTLTTSQSVDSGNNTNWFFSTSRIWVGTTNSWNTASNWNPVGVPKATDPLLFNGTGNNPCSVDTNASALSINVQSGFTQTITGSQPLTVYSDFSAADGTFALGTSSLTVRGNWSNTGLTFNGGTGTVVFNSTTTGKTILSGGEPFYNVVFNNSAGYWTLSDSMTVTSSVTLTAGTLDVSASSLGISVGNAWLNTGGAAASFVPRLGTVLFNGAGTTSQIQSGGDPFANVAVGGTGYWTLVDSMTVTSTMTITSGTLDTAPSGFGITVGGGWTNTGGRFTVRTSTVIFNATTAGNEILSTGDPFSTVMFTGSGYWTLADSMTVTSSMTITNGTFDTGASEGIAVTGSWYQTGGSFLGNSSTVTFNGSTVGMRIRTTGRPLGNVSISGAGYWTLLDSMTLTGTFSQSAGTLDVSSTFLPISVGGGWQATGGTYTVGRATVTFTGVSGGGFIESNGGTFGDVVFNGPGDYWTLVDSMTVNSTMTITNGTLDASPSNNPIRVAGSWINTGGAFVAYDSTVTFSGSTIQRIDSSGSPFGYVNITGAGPFNLMDSMTVTNDLTLSAGALNTTTSGHAISVGGEWLNFGGVFTVNASSVSFTGSGTGNRIRTRNYRFFQIFFPGSGSWTPVTNSVTASTVTLNGGSLVITSASTMTVLGDMDVGTGSTLTINGALGIGGGDLTNTGTITSSVDMSTLTVSGTGTLGGTGSTTLPRVTMTGSGTTTLGGDVVFQGSMTIATSHTLDVSASNYQITASSDWVNSGTFNAQNGTVIFNSTAAIFGNTTFRNLTATTPGITLTFQSGSTQTVSGTLTITGASGNRIRLLPSATLPWFINPTATANVTFVGVQKSTAMSQILYVGQSSQDLGNNINWVFDFVPAAIAGLAASAQSNGDVLLSWNSATDSDDNPLGVGSYFAIQYSTWAVTPSTSSADTGVTFTSHVFVSTSGVSGGSAQRVTIPGLSGTVAYNFWAWTRDPMGYWSSVSNTANATVTSVLSISLSGSPYDFGPLRMSSNSVSNVAVGVTNAGNVTQTYTLSITTTGPTSAWSVGIATPTSHNTFAMFGQFNTVKPSSMSFQNWDIITSTPTASTSSIFAGNQSGVSATAGAAKNLWFFLNTPLTTSTTAQEQMDITITATTP